MIAGATILGWVLTIAVDGAILAAFIGTMFVALRATQAWLLHRDTGDLLTGVIILFVFCGLFVGAWLPVGLVLATRSLLRRVRAA
ncbi:MAG TPA: hypothetical protein VNV44_03240 [Solirubrobacteraceae bacterium]|jgi:hypothetical protein|nr:hypothetical protein [Solirubrobacteraceae bacterium]